MSRFTQTNSGTNQQQQYSIVPDRNSRYSGPNGDVAFVVAGREFVGLRMSLYSQSELFKKLFEQNPSVNRYIINDVTPNVFKALLDYLQSGHLDGLNIRSAAELLVVAHKVSYKITHRSIN